MNSIIWIIIEILVNIYQGIICSYFIASLLGYRKRIYKYLYIFICGGIQSVMITILNIYTIFEGTASILYYVEYLLFAFVWLNGNTIKKLFACALPLFTGLTISFIMINFFVSINNCSIAEIVQGSGISRIMLLLSTQILYYVSFRLLLKAFKTDDNKFKAADWYIIISVMMITLSLAAIIHSIAIKVGNDQIRSYINVSVVILIVLNVLVFHLTISINKKNKIEQELEMHKLKEQYQSIYIESTKQQYDSIRKIRHDTNNSFLTICELISEGKSEEAYRFAKENTELIASLQTYVNTRNSIVNAIINSKLSYASTIGVKVSCLSVNDFSGIEDTDLCRLLSNMLDNAIASLETIEDKSQSELSIEINCEENSFYSFVVRNTIKESVLKKNPVLDSTKDTKDKHGFGIKIIKEIAAKYDGRADFYEEYDKFCCQINLIAKENS